jgi:hypothetical protein
VVLTDGADNAALAEGLSPSARAELRALGIPVTGVAVGSGALKDLAVERVAVDDFAFVRNTVTVEVSLAARGFGREEVPVVLRREGAVVARATARLEAGKERYTVPLSFAPDTTGTFVFTVAAPVYPGEAVAENNSRSFVLRVIRDGTNASCADSSSRTRTSISSASSSSAPARIWPARRRSCRSSRSRSRRSSASSCGPSTRSSS